MRQQSPTTVVMEACYSSHYWGREIAKLGHDTKLIPAQHVTPFVQGNKKRDILFVSYPRTSQKKTALSNQSRGLLSEFAVVFPCGHKALIGGLNSVIDMLIEYETTLKRLKGIEQQ
jgi:transposase